MRGRWIILEAGWLLKKAYPPFVYAPRGAWKTPGAPVFIFHSIDPAGFEAQMGYLAENGYRTPGIEDFYGWVSEKKPLPGRSVLLTFDDGDKSLYDAAFPVLARYGFKAVAFICPGLTGDSEDGRAGRFLVWDEIIEMQGSGFVDFQSHTLSHELMFVNDRITGFFGCGFSPENPGTDVPRVFAGGRPVKLLEPGAPLYETGSRMGERPRYFDDELLREKCIKFVEERGGHEYFRGWNRLRGLRQFAERERRKSGAGRFEKDDEREEAIYRELAESKKILEDRLGKKVRHLAYPWGTGSRASVRMSVKAGYRTNFWGPLENVRSIAPGGDPYHIPRLKDDYIFRLPGRGRKTFAGIFARKIARRLSPGGIY